MESARFQCTVSGHSELCDCSQCNCIQTCLVETLSVAACGKKVGVKATEPYSKDALIGQMVVLLPLAHMVMGMPSSL